MVILSECRDYDKTNVAGAFERMATTLGMNNAIRPGMRVVIKPNLLMRAKPDAQTTTHPSLVEAVATYVVQRGAAAIIADSPGGPYTPRILERLYQETGMKAVADSAGAVCNLNTTHQSVQVGGRAVDVIEPILRADLVINLCKCKTHALARFTGGVKNLFGVVPGLTKAALHMRYPDTMAFCDLLVDLYEYVKPAFTIMDAVVGMEGDGPSGGTPKGVGLLIGADDAHELDMVACHIVGFKYREVPTLLLAKRRGLLPDDVHALEIVGDPDAYRVDFKKPSGGGIMSNAPLLNLRPIYPVIDHRKCVSCMVCRDNCPAKTIVVNGNTPVIQYNDCIRCFCCHELCPKKAIDLKRKWRIRRTKSKHTQ